MWLEMITNKRILDFDLQMSRLFVDLISETEYDAIEVAEGLYDFIFTHREGIQDNYESIKEYTKPTTKIVVDITTESGNLQPFLDYFYELTNTEPFQFYLIVDSDLTNYVNNVDIKYKLLHSFDIVYYGFLNEKSDSKIEGRVDAYKNGFISLNNSVRVQRVVFLLELLRRNISLDTCSFLFTTADGRGSVYTPHIYDEIVVNLHKNNFITEADVKLLTDIKPNLPKIIDYDVSKPTYIYNRVTDEVYKYIINFVTENVTGIDRDTSPYGLITFTEKCIKPFHAGQIPLMLSLLGTQNILRKLGFDLYDDIIDTSYETETNPYKRVSMMVDELEKLMKLDVEEFKKNNINRFEANFNNLQRLHDSAFEKIKSFLYDEIYK
jgi:hypothetical protein